MLTRNMEFWQFAVQPMKQTSPWWRYFRQYIVSNWTSKRGIANTLCSEIMLLFHGNTDKFLLQRHTIWEKTPYHSNNDGRTQIRHPIFRQAWLNNYIHYEMWDKITYPFSNFKGATVEVCECISNFSSHFIVHVITYPCLYQISSGW